MISGNTMAQGQKQIIKGEVTDIENILSKVEPNLTAPTSFYGASKVFIYFYVVILEE